MAPRLQDCDCGFIDSNDPTNTTFANFFSVNFSSISTSKFEELFTPASYVLGRDAPYARNLSADQVQLSDAGLKLIVSPPNLGTAAVPSAQITTLSKSFLYGSYHASVRVGRVPGTVAAFFHYHNDSSEVDVEYVSGRDDPALLYSVKPQIYDAKGNPDSSTFQRGPYNETRSSFEKRYHEWSFVWLPDIVHFGLDSNYTASIRTNVPKAPGQLSLSQWSDGNEKYSMGPPDEESVVDVSFLWAVYNDSNANTPSCSRATEACTVTNGILMPNVLQWRNDSDVKTSASAPWMASNPMHGLSTLTLGWVSVLLALVWFNCRRL